MQATRIFLPGQDGYANAAERWRRLREHTHVSLPIIVDGQEYRKVIFTYAWVGIINTGDLRGTVVLDTEKVPVTDPALVKAVCKATELYWIDDPQRLEDNARPVDPAVYVFSQALHRSQELADLWWDQQEFSLFVDVFGHHVSAAEKIIPVSRALRDLLSKVTTKGILSDRDAARIGYYSLLHSHHGDSQDAVYLNAEDLARRCLERLTRMPRSVRAEMARIHPDLYPRLWEFTTFLIRVAMELRPTGPQRVRTWHEKVRRWTQEGLTTYRLQLATTAYEAIPDLIVVPDVGERGTSTGALVVHGFQDTSRRPEEARPEDEPTAPAPQPASMPVTLPAGPEVRAGSAGRRRRTVWIELGLLFLLAIPLVWLSNRFGLGGWVSGLALLVGIGLMNRLDRSRRG